MPQFTFRISDENLARANDAAQRERGMNIKQAIAAYVKNIVKLSEGDQQAEEAREAVVVPEDFIEIT